MTITAAADRAGRLPHPDPRRIGRFQLFSSLDQWQPSYLRHNPFAPVTPGTLYARSPSGTQPDDPATCRE